MALATRKERTVEAFLLASHYAIENNTYDNDNLQPRPPLHKPVSWCFGHPTPLKKNRLKVRSRLDVREVAVSHGAL